MDLIGNCLTKTRSGMKGQVWDSSPCTDLLLTEMGETAAFKGNYFNYVKPLTYSEIRGGVARHSRNATETN